MDPEKLSIIQMIVDEARPIPNLAAIALGGSYAQATQHAHSDIDLGFYYWESAPFTIQAIRDLAHKIDDRPEPIVTDFYGWGPWVNGGAWLVVGGQRVDFLYRNIDQLQHVIDECIAGISIRDYDQQPPYGFYSHIYLGEIHICKPLYDPDGTLSMMKAQISRYPIALKKSLINNFLWGAEFTLAFADKSAQRGDVYGTVGCLARASANLTQVLYALNECYFVTDKGALRAIEMFPKRPDGYVQTISKVLGNPGRNAGQLVVTVERLKQLLQKVVALCWEWYEPKYRL